MSTPEPAAQLDAPRGTPAPAGAAQDKFAANEQRLALLKAAAPPFKGYYSETAQLFDSPTTQSYPHEPMPYMPYSQNGYNHEYTRFAFDLPPNPDGDDVWTLLKRLEREP